MLTGTVAIFVSESKYAEKLMDYIEDKAGLPFKTIAFTLKEELQKYLENKIIDLLLVSVDEMCEEIERNVKRIVLLSSGTVPQKFKKYDAIFRYQSMENIIREMLTYYMEGYSEEDVLAYKVQADIIGVYSPIGNRDKSLFALTLGQIMAAEKKVLYLNLEEFTTFEKLLNVQFYSDLADLMYFFKQNREMISIKLQAIVRSLNKLDFVPPMNFFSDLRDLEADCWIDLIESISVSAGYDVIIVDFGNMIRDFLSVLEICKLVYMPISENYIENKRIEVFEEYLLRTGKDNLLDKIEKVLIPYLESKSWSDSYFEELRWGPFGEFISELINEERWSLES